MASQVLSGPSNPTYTNSTPQNVRLILSFMDNVRSVSWAGVTANLSNFKLDYPSFIFLNQISQYAGGQSIFPTYVTSEGTSLANSPSVVGNFKMVPPHQLTLAPGQTFSAVCGPYNIIIIKEDGT
jgi:hypothetical protein